MVADTLKEMMNTAFSMCAGIFSTKGFAKIASKILGTLSSGSILGLATLVESTLSMALGTQIGGEVFKAATKMAGGVLDSVKSIGTSLLSGVKSLGSHVISSVGTVGSAVGSICSAIGGFFGW